MTKDQGTKVLKDLELRHGIVGEPCLDHSEVVEACGGMSTLQKAPMTNAQKKELLMAKLDEMERNMKGDDALSDQWVVYTFLYILP